MSKQFKVVHGSFVSEFEHMVQESLDDKWDLAGPVFGEKGHLYAPMTRDDSAEGDDHIDDTETRQHPDAKRLGDKKG